MQQQDDFKWFIDNYVRLFEQYGVCYLAISNKHVIGSYKSLKEGIVAASEVAPMGQFIVQKCNGDETAYTNYIASAQIQVI